MKNHQELLIACLNIAHEVVNASEDEDKPVTPAKQCDLIGACAARIFKGLERNMPDNSE